jgi:cell division protein FtsZ
MKQVDAANAASKLKKSPMEMTIEEIELRADERRKTKRIQLSFIIMFLKLMSMKEPAYKRLGIEISNTQSNNTN